MTRFYKPRELVLNEAHPLAKHIIGVWPSQPAEVQTDTLFDLGPNKNHMTRNGTAGAYSVGYCRIGVCHQRNDSSSGAARYTATALRGQTPANGFTWQAWVVLGSASSFPHFVSLNGQALGFAVYSDSSQGGEVRLFQSFNNWSAGSGWFDGELVHLTVIAHDDNTATVYVDGQFYSNGASTNYTYVNPIGLDMDYGGSTAFGGGDYMNGDYIDLRLFDRPLTAHEVSESYHKPWDLYIPDTEVERTAVAALVPTTPAVFPTALFTKGPPTEYVKAYLKARITHPDISILDQPAPPVVPFPWQAKVTRTTYHPPLRPSVRDADLDILTPPAAPPAFPAALFLKQTSRGDVPRYHYLRPSIADIGFLAPPAQPPTVWTPALYKIVWNLRPWTPPPGETYKVYAPWIEPPPPPPAFTIFSVYRPPIWVKPAQGSRPKDFKFLLVDSAAPDAPDTSPFLTVNSTVGPLLETEKLRRTRPIINRNLSALRRDTTEEIVEALIKHLEDVQSYIDWLADRNMAARQLQANGLPKHGEYCEALDGQYVHLTSTGPGSIIAVRHGLGKTPQGVVWVYQTAVNEILIKGDEVSGISPANKEIVYFWMAGDAGNEAIGVIF